MSDEIFALMEAADATQKAARSLVEKADQQTRAAQAAIAKLDALPAAVAGRITGEIARAIEKEAQAVLDKKIKRLQMVGAWWPLIFAVLFLALCGMGFHVFQYKTLERLYEARAELTARRAELAATPRVISYTGRGGREHYGVEVTPEARPFELSDGKWYISFK